MSPPFRLCLISDRRLADDLAQALELTLAALPPGVAAVQLRENELPDRELLALARQLRTVTRRRGARLLINDRLDIARLAEADGLQLGQRSAPLAAIRHHWPDAWLGSSCHDARELEEATRAGADFALLSPVFPPHSKRYDLAPLGVTRLGALCRTTTLPIFALGGLDASNLAALRDSGCYGAAMIGGWLSAQADPTALAAALRSARFA
ncbi:MAG: thiamine phosphate synthase [Myxococcales bacterium]|nr:thiamine phosphate synthase [Myxococcales bacterium]